MQNKIKLFENKKVRTVWNENELQLPALHHKTEAENFKREFFEMQEHKIINNYATQ